MVATLVGAAALAAGQRPEQRRLGREERRAQVQGVGQVGIALGGGADVDLAGQSPQLNHTVKAVLQAGVVADDPQVSHMVSRRARCSGRAN